MLANGSLHMSIGIIALLAVHAAGSATSAGAQCPDIVTCPEDAPPDGDFGSTVSVTPDGTKMVAGILYFTGPSGLDSGAAWVFEVQGSAVVETMLLPSNAEPLAYFGRAVAISEDGKFIAVGAPLDTTTVQYGGSVRIFVNDGPGSWIEQATLLADMPVAGDYFGEAVAISADGTRVVVGARFAYDNHGAAYVFHRDGEVWSLEAELNSGLPAGGAEYGYSVAIAAAGDRVIIGAPSVGFPPAGSGAAIVFNRTDSTWKRRHTFEGTDAGSYLGRSVDISADGETVLIGAVGPAFVAKHAGHEWTPPALLSSCNPSAFFGYAVSLSAQGDVALIGAPGQGIAGATQVFEMKSGTWRKTAQLLPRQIHNDVEMGRSLDFASVTGEVFVGATRYRVNGMPRGAILQLDPSISCFGDLNQSQTLDIDDLLALIGAWGPCAKATCPADIDLDGTVEADDLAILLDVWTCLAAD